MGRQAQQTLARLCTSPSTLVQRVVRRSYLTPKQLTVAVVPPAVVMEAQLYRRRSVNVVDGLLKPTPRNNKTLP